MTQSSISNPGDVCGHQEEIDKSTKTLKNIAILRDRHQAEIEDNRPYVDMAKKLIENEDRELWERIRSEFPQRAGWAANLAAHGWLIVLEEDRLYALGRGTSYLSHADRPPVKTGTPPRFCVNCQYYTHHGMKRYICRKNNVWILDRHRCDDHAFKGFD